LCDGEAKLAENALDLFDDERDGMLGALPGTSLGKREIVLRARAARAS
jgi:hypothetical protein